MKIVTPRSVARFIRRRPDSEPDITRWVASVRGASWHSPHELREDWPGMKSLRGEHFAFKVCHNKYRLIAHIDFKQQRAQVLFIGTHAEFDRVIAKEYRRHGRR